MSEEILDQLAADMNKLLSEPVGSRRVKITDLTPRDGQQCKLATRVTTDDLLPLCASIDNCGFYAVEVWGGATFDVCMRYLNEDPWERLRRIKAVMPKTKLQMLLRGQHILAYRPYTDKIVYKFVERADRQRHECFSRSSRRPTIFATSSRQPRRSRSSAAKRTSKSTTR